MWIEELFKIKYLVDQKKKVVYCELQIILKLKKWILNKEELLTMIIINDDS